MEKHILSHSGLGTKVCLTCSGNVSEISSRENIVLKFNARHLATSHLEIEQGSLLMFSVKVAIAVIGHELRRGIRTLK